jgi:hypothetical protein
LAIGKTVRDEPHHFWYFNNGLTLICESIKPAIYGRLQDFLSLDPVHSRIATDFAVDRRRYSFRWGGENEPTGEHGCTLKEATIALACAHSDPTYAVQAKREISALWDTDSARYKALFHPNLTATKIWNAVKIMRAVDRIVAAREANTPPKADMVANHLQRVVLHIVFQDPKLSGWEVLQDSNTMLPVAEGIAEQTFEAVRKDVVEHHSSEYLASLSKNYDKCTTLVARVRNPAPAPPPSPADKDGRPMLPFPDP